MAGGRGGSEEGRGLAPEETKAGCREGACAGVVRAESEGRRSPGAGSVVGLAVSKSEM